MKYKGLIFDFDYTLGDSTDGIVLCTNYALECLGYKPAGREAVRKTIGLHLEEIYRVLVRAQGKEEKVSEESAFARLFMEKADEVMTENSSFFPGALELVRKWKAQGYKLAIVTTKYHHRIETILQKYQEPDLFDMIVGGDEVMYPKPDPQGLFQVLEEWGLTKEQALYVGDSLVDARTAQAASVDFAGVTTGTTGKKEMDDYPYVGVFKDLQELDGFLPQ